MPPRRYTNIAPLELHPSILHVGLRFATPSCGALCGARANLIKTFQLPEQLEQTPSKFHAYTPTVCLQSSRARLASSRTPTSTSARLHRASRAPELLEATRLQRTSTFQYRSHAYSAPPELTSSILPHLHARSAPAEVLSFIPLRLHACSASPELPNSISPRPHTYITPPELHSSTPYTPAAPPPAPCLYASTSTRLQRASRAPELHTSTSAHLQHASRAPELHTSTICTPTAHLQSSRTLEANSTSTHLYHATRAPFLHADTPAAHLTSSRAPFIHTYTPAARLPSPRLHSSTPLRLHACRGPPELYTSIRINISTFHPLPLRSALRGPLFCQYLYSFTSTYLRRVSGAPYPYTSASLHLHSTSRAPYLYTSLLIYLQRTSIPPELHTSVLPRLSACSALPALHTSMHPRRCTCGAPQSFMLPRRYAYFLRPDLYASMPPYHHAIIAP